MKCFTPDNPTRVLYFLLRQIFCRAGGENKEAMAIWLPHVKIITNCVSYSECLTTGADFYLICCTENQE